MIVADPELVLNFTMPWIVDGMSWNWKSVGRPRSMSVSDRWFITENCVTLVILSFTS